MNVYKFIFGLLLVSLVAACNGSKPITQMPEEAIPVQASILTKGAYSSVESDSNMLILDQTKFQELWRSMHSMQMPIPELPIVDFEKQAVVASFLGMKNSGGYAVNFVDARTHKDVLYILMTSTSPGAGCFTTNAITYPFVMAVVEKGSFTDYQFLMTQEVIDCDR